MKNEKVFLLAPLHIKSKGDIADIFGVSPDTVTKWAKEGAPIFLVGNKYQVDYYSLVNWLSKSRPAFNVTQGHPSTSLAGPV